MAKNNKNNKRGLGRGLDSLIPKIKENEEKNNSSITLEDILSGSEDEEVETNEDKTVEDKNIQVTEDKEEEKTKELDHEITEKNVEEVDKEKTDENHVEKSEKSDIDKASEDLIENDNQKEASSEKENEEIKEIEENQSPEIEENTEEIKEKVVLSDYELASIEEVKEIIEKNPRITLWSAKSSAVFRYLRKTRPEFSISKEASELIDYAVSKRYPKIWKLFEDL